MSDVLELHESVGLVEAPSITKPDGTVIPLGFDGNGNPSATGVFDAKGRVPIHVIRPGVGRGRGRHLYEAAMLQEAAPTFVGWKMYQDHLSPEAKKALGGLPRKVAESGGIIKEAWWDPSTPADDRHPEPGSVMAMVRPVRAIRDLIDDDPALVEASISAMATGVKPVQRDGQQTWMVEGIQPKGSVDWVSEAGAGGRVAPLLEAAYEDPSEVAEALLESMSDDELQDHMRAERPHLIEALAGDVRPEATTTPTEVIVSESAELTQEQLQEALAKDPASIAEAIFGTTAGQEYVNSLVEARMGQEREITRAQARADAQREVRLAQLDIVAERQISEAKLPPVFASHVRAMFRLEESGEPTAGLNVFDQLDENDAVVKTDRELLKEAIEAEVTRQRELLAEAAPTLVRGQGAGRSVIAGNTDGAKPPAPKETAWGKYLQEHNIDPAAAYGIPLETAGQ